MGFNNYIVDKEIIRIQLKKKTGEEFECIFDKEDLDKINFVRWHLRLSSKYNFWYAHATQYLGTINGKPKYKSLQMSKVILDVPRGRKVFVDHKNHNTLDNRKENLRITDFPENMQNRKSKNSNNTSGYRNVSWDKSYEQWKVQLQVNGKNTCLGYFDDVNKAGEFAKIKREELYGEFAGED